MEVLDCDPGSANGTSLSRQSKPRILFADDECLIQMAVTHDLTEAGFEVVEVASGDEGLDALREGGPFDVLLTDIRMPGQTDGWDLAEAARAVYPGIGVIYTSGYSAVELRPVAGGVFIAKPYRSRVIIAGIEAILAKEEPARAIFNDRMVWTGLSS